MHVQIGSMSPTFQMPDPNLMTADPDKERRRCWRWAVPAAEFFLSSWFQKRLDRAMTKLCNYNKRAVAYSGKKFVVECKGILTVVTAATS